MHVYGTTLSYNISTLYFGEKIVSWFGSQLRSPKTTYKGTDARGGRSACLGRGRGQHHRSSILDHLQLPLIEIQLNHQGNSLTDVVYTILWFAVMPTKAFLCQDN